jgi:hypothetical protein
MSDIFESVEFLKQAGEATLRRFVATHRGATYAELRFEAMFSRAASANDEQARDGAESEALRKVRLGTLLSDFPSAGSLF